MWDEGLPPYTGSFEDNIILCMIYLRHAVFYAVFLLGILFIAIALISPLCVAYFSIGSLKIKVKQHKTKEQIAKLKNEEHNYIGKLEKHLKKKSKKKRH